MCELYASEVYYVYLFMDKSIIDEQENKMIDRDGKSDQDCTSVRWNVAWRVKYLFFLYNIYVFLERKSLNVHNVYMHL